MTYQEARTIIGNQPLWAIRNMAKALAIHSWLNTPEEARRLEAARTILARDTLKRRLHNA